MLSYCWLLIIAFGFSLIANRLALGLAPLLRLVDRPGLELHKQHAHTVPYGGGLAMAVALVATVLIARQWHFWPGESFWPPTWPILGGALVLLAVGFWDDCRPLRARHKLLLQLLVASLVVWLADLRIDQFRQWPWLSAPLAVLWCVLVTNAYNLLDHADGLSASSALISTLVLTTASFLSDDTGGAAWWLGLGGVLVGFLFWNRPPARLYMGDAGSLPLGFLMATGTLMVTFWHSDRPTGSPLGMLAPLLIIAVPLYDTLIVVVKRFRRGLPLMRGDRRHIHHRLGRLGLPPAASLAVTISLQTALAAGALQLASTDLVEGLVVLIQSGGILLAVMLLEANRDHD